MGHFILFQISLLKWGEISVSTGFTLWRTTYYPGTPRILTDYWTRLDSTRLLSPYSRFSSSVPGLKRGGVGLLQPWREGWEGKGGGRGGIQGRGRGLWIYNRGMGDFISFWISLMKWMRWDFRFWLAGFNYDGLPTYLPRVLIDWSRPGQIRIHDPQQV